APQPREQLVHLEVVGADAVHRRDDAMEHVVEAAKAARALDGEDVERLFDDADDAAVAAVVAADVARIRFGDVLTDRAEDRTFLQLDDRVGEAEGIVVRDTEEVIREALRALRSDAGKLVEFVDELCDG